MAFILLLVSSPTISASSSIVHYTSSFTFPNLLPGETIEITKVCDPDAGTLRLTSNSQRIQSGEDLVRLERQEAALVHKKQGALAYSRLSAMLDTLQPDGKLDVLISLRDPGGIVYLDKTKHSVEEMRLQSLSLLTLQPVISISALCARHGLKSKGESGYRVFRAEVTRSELAKLAFDSDIASIEETPPPGKPAAFPFPDIGSLSRSAYWHANVGIPSGAGYGVKAATFERGLYSSIIACWGGLNPAQIDLYPVMWEHGHQVFRVLMVTAPAASLWHKNSITYGFQEAYIIDNGIQTMSRSTSNTEAYTGEEMRFMDDLAYRNPFPVFCNPTHNDGYNQVPSWSCYNAISVGNVRHTNQTHWELIDTTNPGGGCTQTKNPSPIYGSLADREMPMLVAPGIRPSVYDLYESCTDTYAYCGTSLSAPIANGLAADLIAADWRMQSWPEKIRAALIVTAQNVDRGYWSYTSDGRDGAGVVHGAGAVAFAQGHSLVGPNGTAVVDGIGAGSLYATDFNDPNPLTYKIRIPNPKPAGKHLRVVLTWDSNPVLGGITNPNPLSDLDLLVTSGSQGRACQSLNSNVEMVDIPSTLFTAGSTIDARIFKTTNRIPAGSRTNFFYYAVAWTWVKDHAD